MILNARMYSPTPEIAALWNALLEQVAAACAAPVRLFDYPPPQPLGPLWARADKAAVFMCGLPFGLADPAPVAVAVPVPKLPGGAGRPVYWSDLVVRADSAFHHLADTFGGRVALTTLESQSGCVAMLDHLTEGDVPSPPYAEVIGPTVTFLANLRAVIDGQADVAPLDSYGFALLQRHHPELTAQVRVIARTRPMPMPLLVGSSAVPGLAEVFLDLHRRPACWALLDALLLDRFMAPAAEDYAVLARRREVAFAHWRGRPLSRTANPDFRVPAGQ
tara:strand:+ start:636 stop:1463 length:828 start_codon:yes stop_codon:yes gene_type:complete